MPPINAFCCTVISKVGCGGGGLTALLRVVGFFRVGADGVLFVELEVELFARELLARVRLLRVPPRVVLRGACAELLLVGFFFVMIENANNSSIIAYRIDM